MSRRPMRSNLTLFRCPFVGEDTYIGERGGRGGAVASKIACGLVSPRLGLLIRSFDAEESGEITSFMLNVEC